jgi:hypothetical protein
MEFSPFEISGLAVLPALPALGCLLLRHQQAHFGLIIHDQGARHIGED